MMHTTAIILAGGRGSRMGDRDKAWVEYRGKPLIRHVIDKVAAEVAAIVISYNRSEDNFASLPYPRFTDTRAGFQGPLSGIATCAPHVTTELTLILPCDMPLLPDDLLARLSSALGDQELVIAQEGQRLQPLVMLARTKRLATIQDYLLTGQRSVAGWYAGLDYAVAQFGEGSGAFLNINDIEQISV